MNFCPVKQEPEKYSFDDLIKDGKTGLGRGAKFSSAKYSARG